MPRTLRQVRGFMEDVKNGKRVPERIRPLANLLLEFVNSDPNDYTKTVQNLVDFIQSFATPEELELWSKDETEEIDVCPSCGHEI